MRSSLSPMSLMSAPLPRGRARPARPAGLLLAGWQTSLRVADGLDLDLEPDLVGHDQPPCRPDGVPREGPVLPVHLGPRPEDGLLVTPRVLGEAEVLDVQRDGPGDSDEREVAGD